MTCGASFVFHVIFCLSLTVENFLSDDETTDESQLEPNLLFLWASSFELAIGLLGLVVASIAGLDARAYLPRWDDISVSVMADQIGIGAAAAIPMAIVVWLIMKIPHKAIDAIKRLGDDPTMKSLLSLSYAELFTLSLCAGIGEELAFRGCLLPLMAGMADGTHEIGASLSNAVPTVLVAAVFLSSVAFGLLHPITKLYVGVAGLMGVYFAVLLVVTDSLVVPIVAHAVYDAIQFAIAKRESDQ